jgi:hypothetical protein
MTGGFTMSIILFYTPILNGDELQLLGMVRRNTDTSARSRKPLTYKSNAQALEHDIDVVVVRENHHKVEDAVN